MTQIVSHLLHKLEHVSRETVTTSQTPVADPGFCWEGDQPFGVLYETETENSIGLRAEMGVGGGGDSHTSPPP